MAIPKWVHNNPTTKPLVPLMEEAQQAGYTIDFGPTGKKHPSGKKIAADINHSKKRIRLDVTQINEDFANKAWTKPQVEGVRGIEHNFANAGELAKFYLAHELEHTNPDVRPIKADNENATNERAMKRMLPRPMAKSKAKPTVQYKKPIGPAKMGTPPAINQGMPTESELSALWDELIKIRSNRFSAPNIKAAVAKLVKKGKIRESIAPVVRSYGVYGEDLIRRRDEAIDPVRAARGVDARYFLGGQSEAETAEERALLRIARTGEPGEKKLTPMDRPRRSLGIPDEAEQLLRRSLNTPAGRKLTESTVAYQQRRVGKPRVKNPLARIRPRALRPTSQEKPYGSKGSALAEREAKAKYVGKGIGTKARTKSGSPIYFTFKGSDKPRYYSMDKLKEVLGPGGSDVLAGLSPVEKTVFARLNELAKEGSAGHALRFEKLKTQFYKTGERARQAGKTTREQVWKPPDEKGEFKPRMKDGEPVTEIRTPEVKARKAANSESRRLGGTASEDAARAQRSPKRRKDRGELVQTVEGAIRRGVEDRIRKGLAGPLTPRDAATLKKLQEQELAKYGPEMLEDMRRMSRITDPRRQEAMRILEERMRSREFPGVQHGLPIPPAKKSVVQPLKRLMLGKARRKMR